MKRFEEPLDDELVRADKRYVRMPPWTAALERAARAGAERWTEQQHAPRRACARRGGSMRAAS